MIHQSWKYQKIYNRLKNWELSEPSPDSVSLNDGDLEGDLFTKRRPHLFMDFYSDQGIRKVLQEYGVFKDLQKRGFDDYSLQIDTRDPFRHVLRICQPDHGQNRPLCELCMSRRRFCASTDIPTPIQERAYHLVVIEWILLQDPTTEFSPIRPPLPGQEHPGLRMSRKVWGILTNMCRRLDTDGLIIVPERFHNALFYGRYFQFFDPQTQGEFEALKRDLKTYRIFEQAWAMEWDCIIDSRSGLSFKWKPEEQIRPVNSSLEIHFRSPEYRRRVMNSRSSRTFCLDEDRFRKILSKTPMPGLKPNRS